MTAQYRLSAGTLSAFPQNIDECTAGALSDHTPPPLDVFISVSHRHQACPTSWAGRFPRGATKKPAGKKMPPVLQMLCVRHQAPGLHNASLILLMLIDSSAPRHQDNASNCGCASPVIHSGSLEDACIQVKPLHAEVMLI